MQPAVGNRYSAMHFSRLDALLLLMAVIWGTNYTVAKHAFAEIDAQSFNAARMVVGSAMFLALIVGVRRVARRAPRSRVASIFYTPAELTRRDWWWLAFLGVVGHTVYQYLFIGGLSRTTVANSSLMLAATPTLIAIVTAMLGQERIAPLHWTGIVLSLIGIYFVVGQGAQMTGPHLVGDLMMFGAVACWATYTVAARQVITRHSPVAVTGLSMAIGTALYVAAVTSHVRATAWTEVSASVWLAIVYSSVFSLCIAYTIWYAAVRELGSARTAVYSNLVPLVAMVTAIAALGEPVSAATVAGASAVLVGVALTRARTQQLVIPAEE